ncbi:MAG: hypothetical protein AAFY02_13710, partial [Pseudomonadota bacterium]
MAILSFIAVTPTHQASAQASCDPSGTNTVTCSGSWPAGLGIGTLVPQSTTRVNVRDLTSNIGPASFGIDWGLGGTSFFDNSTRTLDVDMGGFTVTGDTAVSLTSNSLNSSQPNGFGLDLSFVGDAVGTAPGSTILVQNRGVVVPQVGNAGGRVGDLQVTLEGSVSGQAGVRTTTNGGSGGIGNQNVQGGRGASGGTINFDTTGDGVTITTLADGNAGIFASSRGGAGGTTFATRNGVDGGRGGDGGSFFFGLSGASDWVIETAGSGAPGILLNSTGGNGGSAGSAELGRGGDGGSGGAAGQVVTGTITAEITTSGANSPGLVSTSEGGQGGNGGQGGFFGDGGDGGAGGFGTRAQVTGVLNIETSGVQSSGIAVSSVGGAGGRGGDGRFFGSGGSGANTGSTGDVVITLQNGSSIRTKGENSTAVAAQSIGGRGGAGGTSVGLYSFAASGGSGGKAGAIDFINFGSIVTEGNRSTGVLAQSIGGGGGAGGDTFGVFYSGNSPGAVGGAGSAINITNSGQITTSGNAAIGISAQSIGGTGGSGGSSVGLVALGGRGGSGHNGDAVTIVNSGNIETGINPSGAADATAAACAEGCSYGISAQSIGGGGGNGGTSVGWFSVGGGAAGGGSGSRVDITSTGSVATHLENSTAILAQSIGGGGGNGGGSVSGGLGAAVAIGGSGGNGGLGRGVTISLGDAAATTTKGDASHGVHAQSIGGGGGNGAFAAAFSAGFNFPAVAVTVGGTGGTGGAASQVTISTDAGGAVMTEGDDSNGLFAQSIGGGGGNGGFAIAASASNTGAVSVAVGGGGGGGGTGGNSEIANEQSVTTSGLRSVPLLAQSIGGGGGNGGLAVSGSLSAGSIGVSIGVGGGGGDGNFGGEANVSNGGTVESSGDEAPGVIAQSIGGGGGRGSAAIAASLSLSGSTAVSVGVGGGGGTGGNAQLANVQNRGDVTTTGAQSQGVVAQSIAAGGGIGGLSISANLSTSQSVSLGGSIGGSGGAGGTAGRALINNSATVSTSGERSEGLFAQSVGGGGGNGGVAISANVSASGSNGLAMAIGGGGGAAGSGGTVDVTSSGVVETAGDLSSAIFAQSVGGGGGSGGASITGNITKSGGGVSLGFNMGGNGSGGGAGRNVTVTATNDVTTQGLFSDAILAQSVGGSGGSGGTVVSGSVTLSGSPTQLGFGMGGAGGTGGHAGAITVNPNAVNSGDFNDIVVTGDGSRGIVAQSVGGGGGNAGMVVSGNIAGNASKELGVFIGRSGGDGGNGSAVTVAHRGSISTGTAASASETGLDREYGILAQSVGGGGGDGGMVLTGTNNRGKRSLNVAVGGAAGSGAVSGDVSVTKTGSIRTHAERSHGVLAQSIAGGGGNGGSTATFALENEDASRFEVTVGG